MTTDEYPPLTSTNEYPLHPEGIYPDDFMWACATPERPRDGQTAYDWRCAACVVGAEAHIAVQGDDTMWWTQVGGVEPVEKTLSWMVARSRYWFAAPGGPSDD